MFPEYNSWLKKDTFLEWSNCIADVNKGKIGVYATDTFRELLKLYISEKATNIVCSIKDDIYSYSFIVLLSYQDVKINVELDINACSRDDMEQYIKLKVTDAFKKWFIEKEKSETKDKQNKNNKKEKNMNKKLYDVEYDNEVAAIKEKAQSEKKALDAKVEEDLAKAEAVREKAQNKEEATAWASKIKAMYDALIEEDFSEDLAVKFIEIQISK